MGKKLIASVTAAILLVGGAATALANENLEERANVNSSLYCGEYTTLNETVRSTWARMSKKDREYYIKNPSLAFMFPFGIDTSAKEPKGYPACDSSASRANYKPTMPLPTWCPWFPWAVSQMEEKEAVVPELETPVSESEEPEEETPEVVQPESPEGETPEVVQPEKPEGETPEIV